MGDLAREGVAAPFVKEVPAVLARDRDAVVDDKDGDEGRSIAATGLILEEADREVENEPAEFIWPPLIWSNRFFRSLTLVDDDLAVP